MNRILIPAVTALALLEGACSEQMIDLNTQEAVQVASTNSPPPSKTIQRFAVAVEVTGRLLPQAPIRVIARVTGKVATEDAYVQISMPELQNARNSGWRADYRVPIGYVAPIATKRQSLSQNARAEITSVISVEAAGYYRVSVRAASESPAPRRGSVAIQDVVIEDLWLWVDENGGKITSAFDAQLFPDSILRQPGPFRKKTLRDNVRVPSASQSSIGNPPTGSVTWHLQYWNSDSIAYVPAPHIQVSGTYEDLLGSGVTPFLDQSDASGNVVTPCENWYYTSFDANATNAYVTVKPNTVVASYADAVCHTTVNIVTLSNESHVVKNAVQTAEASFTNFGYAHGGVKYYLRSGYTWSTYFAAGDSIQLYQYHVWGNTGAEKTAHEYGHSLHEYSLGGYPRSNNCGSHGLPVYTDLECALTEGFAEYFSVVTRPDATAGMAYDMESDGYRDMNSNQAYPTSDGYQPNGSRIEGAVAAFFVDLTDNTSLEDAVYYPASYLANVIKSCTVVTGGVSGQNKGIDHLIYCMEHSLDSAIFGRFYGRGTHPSSYAETATEPGSWSASAIRTLWLNNLYDD